MVVKCDWQVPRDGGVLQQLGRRPQLRAADVDRLAEVGVRLLDFGQRLALGLLALRRPAAGESDQQGDD